MNTKVFKNFGITIVEYGNNDNGYSKSKTI